MQAQIIGKKIQVSFPWSFVMVEKMKLIPGRHWTGKLWEFPNCQVTRSYLKQFGIKLHPDICLLPPVTVRSSAYLHQRVITGHILNGQPIGVFSETGTGKTRAVIESFQPPVLVVCPPPLIGVWRDEIKKWAPHIEPVILHGPKRTLKTGPVNITSYQTLLRDINFLKTIKFSQIFLDESQLVKNWQAKTTKAVDKLDGRKWVMTGTPYGGKYADVFSQLHLVNRDLFGSKKCFDEAFCLLGGWENKEIVGNKNADLFSEILKRSSIVFRKSECLDLPEKTYQVVNLEMGAKQRQFYKRVKEGGLGDMPISSVLQEIAKLRQISSGFAYPDHFDMECPKLDYLESISWDTPTIIWTNFKKEVEDVFHSLKHLGVKSVIADGEHAAKESVDLFQAGHADVIIANLRSIQYGMTLTRASRAIYYSNTFSLIDRIQSEDRCHRIGTTKPVLYVDLICSEIEQWIYDAVQKKIEIQDEILRRIKS